MFHEYFMRIVFLYSSKLNIIPVRHRIRLRPSFGVFSEVITVV